MDLAGVLVIPRIAGRAEIREPVHRPVRLRATKCDDDRVAAFGDETLRVLVVEEVEGTREAAHFCPFRGAFGRVVSHRRGLGQNLSIGRRKRRCTWFECHGDRSFPGGSRSSIVPSVSPKLAAKAKLAWEATDDAKSVTSATGCGWRRTDPGRDSWWRWQRTDFAPGVHTRRRQRG